MFGSKKGLEQKLSKQGGTVAWATVIDSKTLFTSGSNYENGPYTVGNNNHMKVTLQVEPEAQPAFEVTIHQVFPGTIPQRAWSRRRRPTAGTWRSSSRR